MAQRRQPDRRPPHNAPRDTQDASHVLATAHEALSTSAPIARTTHIDPRTLRSSICAIATAAWRLRRTLAPAAAPIPDEMRRILHHLMAIQDALSELGITVQEHDRTPFITGTALKVLTFQQTPDLLHELVLETIKPSIYLRGELIQMGEVIVGTPGEATTV
jgi:hypothetical protein